RAGAHARGNIRRGGDQLTQAITQDKQIVFHAVGDTGNTAGPKDQEYVGSKMLSDFEEQNDKDKPSFFFHLGDVVYSFGEQEYYYDQFYDAYRNYPAPIFGIAGNHDGIIKPGTTGKSLATYWENFCQKDWVIAPEAGQLSRTAMIQPGVYY